MSAQQIITDHDLWRKGVGGAAARLVGQSDSFAYAGLDLNLAQFASSSFCGTSFSDTTFQRADWSDCTFIGCTFTHCDFQFIAISGCTFVDCNFGASRFDQSSFNDVQFDQCGWDDLTFHDSGWKNVRVLNCTGSAIRSDTLIGEHVDFTGSCFEELEFNNATINS